MKPTVLVIGHKGYIGSEIVKSIDRTKYNVMCVDKNELDITNKRYVNDFFSYKKVNYVILTAALLSGKESDLLSVNYRGTKNVVDAAIKYGCKGIIYSSTFDKDSSYGHSKNLAELYLWEKRDKIKVVILRYAGVFDKNRKSGAIYNFIKNAKANDDIRCVDAWTRFSYLKDVVKANLYFLDNFNSMTESMINHAIVSELINVKELAKIIVSMTNSDSRIVVDPIFIEKIDNDYEHSKYLKTTNLRKAIWEIL